MEQEPHIIRRQLLEFVTDDTAGSYALQDEIVLLYNELVLPMIDRCFSEVSAQRRIAPIDRLELDLGTLDRNNLRFSFLQKAEVALRKKLAEMGGSVDVRFENIATSSNDEDSTSSLEGRASTGREVRRGTHDAAFDPEKFQIDDKDQMAVNDSFHGKTFHFNTDEDSAENGTSSLEMNANETIDTDYIPLVETPYHGKTIQFNLEDDSIDDNHFVPSPKKEDPSADENSTSFPEEKNQPKADEDTATLPNTLGDSAEDARIRRGGHNDEVSDPDVIIADPSPTEDKIPFHGKTIQFDLGDGSDGKNTVKEEKMPDSIEHVTIPLPREEDLIHTEGMGISNVTDLNQPSTINHQPSDSPRTPISLIRFYLQTGLFPWWARETSREAFEHAVRECILDGKDLPQLVALLNRPESLLRFTALPDEVVRAVAVAISPMNEATLLSMQPSWEKLLPAGQLPARQHWWMTVFSASAARRLTQTKAYDPAETITAFLEPYPEHRTDTREKKYRNTYSKRLSLLEKFFSQNGFATETARLRTVHELLSRKGSGTEELSAAQWSSVHDRLLNGENVSEGSFTLKTGSASRENAKQSQAAAEQQPAGLPKTTEPVFSYKEKIFIENAGLVLFWPYLTLFFERLELTEDNRFKNAAAQEKAMIALQLLVYGNEQSPFFEATLPLNKVLCGVFPETPVNTDHPFRKAELKAIDGLLTAVMERSEVGKNLSVAAFREAWLQRKGALSMRDGHWLLQVERKTYDVLLDAKLPWAINIVKLPWMDNLLAVEW